MDLTDPTGRHFSNDKLRGLIAGLMLGASSTYGLLTWISNSNNERISLWKDKIEDASKELAEKNILIQQLNKEITSNKSLCERGVAHPVTTRGQEDTVDALISESHPACNDIILELSSVSHSLDGCTRDLNKEGENSSGLNSEIASLIKENQKLNNILSNYNGQPDCIPTESDNLEIVTLAYNDPKEIWYSESGELNMILDSIICSYSPPRAYIHDPDFPKGKAPRKVTVGDHIKLVDDFNTYTITFTNLSCKNRPFRLTFTVYSERTPNR